MHRSVQRIFYALNEKMHFQKNTLLTLTVQKWKSSKITEGKRLRWLGELLGQFFFLFLNVAVAFY